MGDEWIEHCDICGKQLDQLAGEDFYDEKRRMVTCAAHWKGGPEDDDDAQ